MRMDTDLLDVVNATLKRKNIKRMGTAEKIKRGVPNERDLICKDNVCKSLPLNDRCNLICLISFRFPKLNAKMLVQSLVG